MTSQRRQRLTLLFFNKLVNDAIIHSSRSKSLYKEIIIGGWVLAFPSPGPVLDYLITYACIVHPLNLHIRAFFFIINFIVFSTLQVISHRCYPIFYFISMHVSCVCARTRAPLDPKRENNAIGAMREISYRSYHRHIYERIPYNFIFKSKSPLWSIFVIYLIMNKKTWQHGGYNPRLLLT